MRNNTTLMRLIFIIVIFCEVISANQLDVAKKYGKRFGNKKNNSTTDTKEETKSVLTKASETLVPESTKLPEPVKVLPKSDTLTKQYKYTDSLLETTTSTPATLSPKLLTDSQTNLSNDNIHSKDPVINGETKIAPQVSADEQEVDVDLSQLQVSLPNVKFDCSGRPEGYYGDPDYRCEVFHYCNSHGMRDTFLCPSNSKFNQKDMTCDTDSVEELCQPEPAWGHNHMYPQPTKSKQVASDHSNALPLSDLNNTPKHETKDNYYGNGDSSYAVQGNDETLRKSIIGSNNDRDKSTNAKKDNKVYSYNYFSGNFGDRHRNPAINNNDNNNNNNHNQLKNRTPISSNNYQTFGDANNKNNNNNGNNNKVEKENNGENPVFVYSEPVHRKKQSSTTQLQSHYRKTGQPDNDANGQQRPIAHQSQVTNHDSNDGHHNSKQSVSHSALYSFASAEDTYPTSPMQKTSSAPTPASTPRPAKQYSNRPTSQSSAERPSIKWPKRKASEQSVAPPAPDSPLAPHYELQAVHYEAQPPTRHESNSANINTPQNWATPHDNYIAQYLQTPPLGTTSSESTERPNDGNHYATPNIVEYIPISPIRTQPQNNGKHVERNKQQRPVETPPKWSLEETVADHTQQQHNNPVVHTWNSMEGAHNKPESDHRFNREPVFQANPLPAEANQNSWSPEIKNEKSLAAKNPSTSYPANAPSRPKWAQEIIEMIELPQYQPVEPNNRQHKNHFNLSPEALHNTHYSVESANNYNRVPEQPQANAYNGHNQQQKYHYQNQKNNEHHEPTQDVQPQYQSNVFVDSKAHGDANAFSPLMNLQYQEYRPFKQSENQQQISYQQKPVQDEDLQRFPEMKFSAKQQQFYDNQLKQAIAAKLGVNVDPKFISLNVEKPGRQLAPKKQTNGYVAELLPHEMSHHDIGALLTPQQSSQSQSKHNKARNHKEKYGHKSNKPKKALTSANFLDELLSTENGWTFKHFDTSLETALSQAFPVLPLTTGAGKTKMPKLKHSFPAAFNVFDQNFHHIAHPVGAIQYQPTAAIGQPSASGLQLQLPHQIPVHHNLQAQHSFPMHYYLPYYGLPHQQLVRPQSKIRLW